MAGRSSSVIVSVVVLGLPRDAPAPVTLLRVSWTVSFPSRIWSSSRVTTMFLLASPGAKLRVPAASWKSAPAVAVPPVTA